MNGINLCGVNGLLETIVAFSTCPDSNQDEVYLPVETKPPTIFAFVF